MRNFYVFISHLLFLNRFLLLLLRRRRRGFFPYRLLWWYVLRGRWRWCRVSGWFFVMGLLGLRFFLIIIFIGIGIWPVFLLFFLLLFLIENWLFNLSPLYNLRDNLWLHFWRFLFWMLLYWFRDYLCRGFLMLSIFWNRLILLCSLFLF